MDPSKVNTVYALLAFIVAVVLVFISNTRPEKWERMILYTLVVFITAGGIYALVVPVRLDHPLFTSVTSVPTVGPSASAPSTAPTMASTVNKITDEPLLRYEYKHMTNQTLCVGTVEKFANVWSEFIPNSATCERVRVDFEELGADDTYFYIYDPNRNITTRIPKSGGDVVWTTGSVPPDRSSQASWGPVYHANRVK